MALGVVLGVGAGAVALWGIGGVMGFGRCFLVAGLALWAARNAEPVWNEDMASPELPQPEPEPAWSEPLDMVELISGMFWMGSPDSDEDASRSEKPRHEVRLSGFCISRYPISRQIYRDIMDTPPERWEQDQEDDRLPANYVSWVDAVVFCHTLSVQVGLQPCYYIDGETVEWDANADGYRLPTEAEWEYACRARTATKWFCGDDPNELLRRFKVPNFQEALEDFADCPSRFEAFLRRVKCL